MPIGNITQTMSTISPPPHRGVDVQTVFVNKQEDFQDHLADITIDELNTLKDQLNTRIGEINSTATTMSGYADTASAGASTATTKAGEASTSASGALTSKNQASTFATNSSNSATKASQWADNNYNVEVETGKYSAKHWSTVAQNATVNKVDKVTSTDNAIVRFDGTTGEVQDSSILIDDNGNLNINGTGKRITGDFSNATRSQMVAFKSSITDGNTFLSTIPNGTGIASGYLSYAYTDVDNSPLLATYCANTESVITSAKSGTGSYLPINIYTAGNKKVTIDTSGNLLLTSGTGGLGYGAGSGGTVTQLTSKGTAVTLNKPSGIIIMNNAALAAGATVGFIVNNALFSTADSINLEILGNYVGTGSDYNVWTAVNTTGQFFVNVKNVSMSSLSNSLSISFTLIKGANS